MMNKVLKFFSRIFRFSKSKKGSVAMRPYKNENGKWVISVEWEMQEMKKMSDEKKFTEEADRMFQARYQEFLAFQDKEANCCTLPIVQ